MRRIAIQSGIRHAAQTVAGNGRRVNVFADQPVIVIDDGANNIRHGFIQRAGLILINQAGGAIGHAVSEFVSDHIQAAAEVRKDQTVAISKDEQAIAGIEGIIIILAVMHHKVYCASPVIPAIAAIFRAIKFQGLPEKKLRLHGAPQAGIIIPNVVVIGITNESDVKARIGRQHAERVVADERAHAEITLVFAAVHGK